MSKSSQTACNLRNLSLLAVILAAGFSIGCGQHKDASYTAPSGSTVTVSPDAISNNALASSTCGSFTYSIKDSFKITVADSKGAPINNASISIEAPYSAGSGGGSTPTVMYLIDGDTGATITTYPYQTQTGKFGTKDIFLNLDLSCTWGPVDITIFSGTASTKVTVKVQ